MNEESCQAEEDEEAEDPVEKELIKYGIITENPWEKGVKCVPRFPVPDLGLQVFGDPPFLHGPASVDCSDALLFQEIA